jgi:hypothetical protein
MPFTCGDKRRKRQQLDFQQLECLRLFARQIQLEQVASLEYFRYDVGFQHVQGGNKISVSSSATCVLSLVATGRWTANVADTKKLVKHLLTQTTSADLPDNNPFTIAWILDAVTALERVYPGYLDADDQKAVVAKEKVLHDELREARAA